VLNGPTMDRNRVAADHNASTRSGDSDGI
jgi:hypothetical protein